MAGREFHDGANWLSSPLAPGGTPGAVNAAFAQTTDTQSPRLLYAFPESENVVVLVFSEGLDKSTALNALAYRFVPTRNVLAAQITDDPTRIQLTLSEPLQAAQIYALLVQGTVLDCRGNAFATSDTCFTGLPEKPDFQDVVINEILFNPPSTGVRYVELYKGVRRFLNGLSSFWPVSGTSQVWKPSLQVFLSTFPVAIPFLFIQELNTALRTSNLVPIIMMFLCGWFLGKYSGRNKLIMGIAMCTIGTLLLLITISLGG